MTAAVTCAVTLTVTLIFNTLVNRPKKQREERRTELSGITTSIQTLGSDLKEQVSRNHQDLAAVKVGLQAVLKNELKVRYLKWTDLGYAPEDAKDDLERMYTAYHNLGANGVMDKHRERFLNLPSELKN